MREVHRSAIVPYPAEAMYRLVADLESYPEFLPGCTGSAVLSREPDAVVASLAKRNRENRAIYEFAEMDKVYADFPDWFLGKCSRLPTEAEIKEMERLSMETILRKMVINI